MSERLRLSGRVEAALRDGRPVVALETSVLAQGLRSPHNLEAASAMEQEIRAAGAEPAWIWVDGGAVRIGLERADLHRLTGGSRVVKVARRDLPVIVASGGAGATTVSAALWAASAAGIEVTATGGIGGVHRGTGDVSADLFELSQVRGTLVCSGPKSILDPGATLERLEELGVLVMGYRCSFLPFFLSASAGLPLEHRAETPAEVAATARARQALAIGTALVVCNPVPEGAGLPLEDVERAVSGCLDLARRRGVSGKALTPFLLGCIADATNGASVEANIALLRANAGLAAEVSAAVLSEPT